MKKFIKLFALFLISVFHTACGQNQTNVPKDSIKPETKDVITSAAPNNIVRTIIQDRKGNIWMASWDGIIRYDGKSFTNITSKITSARFFSVLEDRKGNFWFGTVGEGVYYYDGKSLQHFTTKEGLLGNTVISICEDKKGNIWFGGGGLSRYDGKFFQNFTTKEGLCNNDVNTIMEDKTGKLWIGTRGDACTYDARLPARAGSDGNGEDGQGKTFSTLTNKDGKGFKNVWSIIKDKKGNIWLGGECGLWRYDGTTYTNFTQNFVGYIDGITYPDSTQNFVGYMYEDKNGNILTNSSKSGHDRTWALSRYDENSLSSKELTVTEIKSEEGMYFGILEALDGSIWVGTGSGVYRYDGKTFTYFKNNESQK